MNAISPTAAAAAPAPRFFNFGISDSTAVRNPKPGTLETMTSLNVYLSPSDDIVSGKHGTQSLLVAPDGQSWDEISDATHTLDGADLTSKPVTSLAAALAKSGLAELHLKRTTNEIGDGTEDVAWSTSHTGVQDHAAVSELPTNVRAVYDAALAVIAQ